MVFVPLSVAPPLVKVSLSVAEPNSKTIVDPVRESPPLEMVMVRPTPSWRLIVALVALSEETLEDNALEPLKVSVPAVTEIAPLFVFVPLSVSVPTPDFVKSPDPWSEPAKVWVPASATVSVCAEAIVTLPPVEPPPWREAIVSLEFTLNPTPAVLTNVTVPVFAIALPPLMVRLPALIVVVPV